MPTIKNYLSLVKFSHTIFALPFALVGVSMGFRDTRVFEFKIFIFVLLCMVFARTSAMAFNRLIDRDFDAQNPRTVIREIPSGIVSPLKAQLFVLLNALLFVVSAYCINPLCFYLSPIALLVILGYSYTKRFTALCHIVLGIGLALAPVGSYIAVTERFEWSIITLGFVVLTWVSGFDIIYALQDDEFDKSHKLLSIPVYFGREKALFLSRILHFLSACLLISFGILQNSGFLFGLGTAFFCALLIYQHTLVKTNDLSKVTLAFFTTNGIASVIFGIFTILDIVLLK